MTKLQHLSLSILLGISALLGFATLTSGHNWAYSDFAGYIMQAKSILAWDVGTFIEQNTVTILESDFAVGPIAYPWGYPLLLAPIIALMGLSTMSMKLLNILLFAIFLLSLYFIARKRLSHFDSLALLALFSLNPIFLMAQDYILSDIAFLCLSTFAILLIDYWNAASNAIQRFSWQQWLVGIVIFAAFLTRTNGLLLLPSLIAYEIYFSVKRRNVKGSIFHWAVPTFIFILLSIIFSFVFPDGQASHLERYKYFQIPQLLEFSIAYINLGVEFFAEIPASYFFYIFFGIFFFIGLIKKFTENLLFSLYFFSTLLLYISWPYLQGIRFLFPIIPFFVYISFQGMRVVTEWLPARVSGWFTFGYRALIVMIAAMMFFSSAQSALQNLANDRAVHGPFDDVAIELFETIKKTTPEDSRIIFFKPRVMSLMTGRDSILILSCENLPKADYVAINLKWEDMGQIAPDEITSCPIPMDELYKNRRFALYKIGD